MGPPSTRAYSIGAKQLQGLWSTKGVTLAKVRCPFADQNCCLTHQTHLLYQSKSFLYCYVPAKPLSWWSWRDSIPSCLPGAHQQDIKDLLPLVLRDFDPAGLLWAGSIGPQNAPASTCSPTVKSHGSALTRRAGGAGLTPFSKTPAAWAMKAGGGGGVS